MRRAVTSSKRARNLPTPMWRVPASKDEWSTSASKTPVNGFVIVVMAIPFCWRSPRVRNLFRRTVAEERNTFRKW
jgi:hypothetical protein